MEEELRMIASQKGKPLLSYLGYVYVEEKQTNNKIYWRCKLYTAPRFRCPGRVHTLKETKSVIQKHNHNHNPYANLK